MVVRRYRVCLSKDRAVRDKALALRGQVFRGGGDDSDRFDGPALHGLVSESETGAAVCCFRLLGFGEGDALSDSYSATWYDMAPLAQLPGPKLELGRFAVAPGWRDPDIIRLAWAEITAELDRRGAGSLFGCSSFPGTDATRFDAALTRLAACHIGPIASLPGRRAGQHVVEMSVLAARDTARANGREAFAQMPPLLRAYLSMGGWVSDHAVYDPELGTTHVLTVLEVSRVPNARRQRMRDLAGTVLRASRAKNAR